MADHDELLDRADYWLDGVADSVTLETGIDVDPMAWAKASDDTTDAPCPECGGSGQSVSTAGTLGGSLPGVGPCTRGCPIPTTDTPCPTCVNGMVPVTGNGPDGYDPCPDCSDTPEADQ